MESDSVLRRFWPLSIAARITVWYALLAFGLIFAATGILYRVLVTNLEQEDNRILADHLVDTRLVLLNGSSLPISLPEKGPPNTSGQQPLVYIRIIDDAGRALLETPGLSNELAAPTTADLASLTSTEGTYHTIVSRSGKRFEVLTARVANDDANEAGRFIQVAIDRDSERNVLAQYRERMWFVLSLSLVLCSLIGYAIARGAMRPIKKIGYSAERVGSSTLHERIATRGLPEELLRLAETFNNMLDRLQESFARVSQFSDDVAHELRTPINNLRGEMEVALGKVRSNEDYHEILGSCLEEAARISRVIESLLFLARAENAREPFQREKIDVGKELAAVQEFYEAAAAEAGIDLRLSLAADLGARVDRTLFQQAVGNLVSNAISHTPTGGSVQITAHADPIWLYVGVADTGCGISTEHLPRVFDRFYRVDRARSGSHRNVGLGLALVKSIVARHGGRIEIDSEVGRGTKVTLLFLLS